MANHFFLNAPEATATSSENKSQQCDPPNTYSSSRRMLGRFAPGIRRASGPVPVIADVRHEINPTYSARRYFWHHNLLCGMEYLR